MLIKLYTIAINDFFYFEQKHFLILQYLIFSYTVRNFSYQFEFNLLKNEQKNKIH